ncbi:hypothetical protein [Paraburkholderia sp. C35]|uniref:hypothetical protein n=1 Tax=Paraburkholderia sp. C35 TaxID=2126993 RepID=UPI0013A53862|nr:hypothetical protein [Paraburkholderia sp. C35]
MRTAYNDVHSRLIFRQFKESLEPLIARVAPDWLLHHIDMERRHTMGMCEEVTIRLVIRPIGDAKFSGPPDRENFLRPEIER